MLAHLDDVAIEMLMVHSPSQGRRPPGLTCEGGKLCPEWRELLLKYQERFMIGSDTWVNPRWADYDRLMQGYRAWPGDLPPAVPHRIAWDNGARLFGVIEK